MTITNFWAMLPFYILCGSIICLVLSIRKIVVSETFDFQGVGLAYLGFLYSFSVIFNQPTIFLNYWELGMLIIIKSKFNKRRSY